MTQTNPLIPGEISGWDDYHRLIVTDHPCWAGRWAFEMMGHDELGRPRRAYGAYLLPESIEPVDGRSGTRLVRVLVAGHTLDFTPRSYGFDRPDSGGIDGMVAWLRRGVLARLVYVGDPATGNARPHHLEIHPGSWPGSAAVEYELTTSELESLTEVQAEADRVHPQARGDAARVVAAQEGEIYSPRFTPPPFVEG